MALSGIEIYKLLPQTNCKECGFPTCLAFAMKLAAKQVELDDCPYVTDESKASLAELQRSGGLCTRQRRIAASRAGGISQC